MGEVRRVLDRRLNRMLAMKLPGVQPVLGLPRDRVQLLNECRLALPDLHCLVDRV
jgi:hypothetical protein